MAAWTARADYGTQLGGEFPKQSAMLASGLEKRVASLPRARRRGGRRGRRWCRRRGGRAACRAPAAPAASSPRNPSLHRTNPQTAGDHHDPAISPAAGSGFGLRSRPFEFGGVRLDDDSIPLPLGSVGELNLKSSGNAVVRLFLCGRVAPPRVGVPGGTC